MLSILTDSEWAARHSEDAIRILLLFRFPSIPLPSSSAANKERKPYKEIALDDLYLSLYMYMYSRRKEDTTRQPTGARKHASARNSTRRRPRERALKL